MPDKPQENPKPKPPEAGRELTDTKRQLESLKQSFEAEKATAETVTKFLEQYLEKTDQTDGHLPESLTPDQIKEISQAFTPDQIQKLASMVLDEKIKAELTMLAPFSGPLAGTTNPLLAKMNGYIEVAMNNEHMKPLMEKFTALGIKKDAIAAYVLTGLSQLLLVFKAFPLAQNAAAEIAFHQCGSSIQSNTRLKPEEKAAHMAAFNTEAGKQNFMVAFDDWVAKGTPAGRKPTSAALLAPTPAPMPIAQAPAAATPEKAVPTLGTKVEGKSTLALVSGAPLEIMQGTDKKMMVTTGGASAEVSITNLPIANIFTMNASGTEKAKITLELSNSRKITLDAEVLRDAVHTDQKKLLMADGMSIELKKQTA